MRVKVTRNTFVRGELVMAGLTYDLPKEDAKALIMLKKAELSENQPEEEPTAFDVADAIAEAKEEEKPKASKRTSSAKSKSK